MNCRLIFLLILTLAGCTGKPDAQPAPIDTTDSIATTPTPVDSAPSTSPPSVPAGVPFGISGSEPAVIDSSRAGVRGYFHGKHLVVVREDTAMGIGEFIDVVRRRDGEKAVEAIERALTKPDHRIANDDANFYFGLAGDRIFIDQGTGPEPRGLLVHDLANGRIAYSGSYSTPVRLLDADRLELYREIDKPARLPDCPEQTEWTTGGLGIAWEERIIIDLRSAAESPTGDIRCAPRQ